MVWSRKRSEWGDGDEDVASELLCLQPFDSSPFHSCPNKESETVQRCHVRQFVCEQASPSVVQITIAYCTTPGAALCSRYFFYKHWRSCAPLCPTQGAKDRQRHERGKSINSKLQSVKTHIHTERSESYAITSCLAGKKLQLVDQQQAQIANERDRGAKQRWRQKGDILCSPFTRPPSTSSVCTFSLRHKHIQRDGTIQNMQWAELCFSLKISTQLRLLIFAFFLVSVFLHSNKNDGVHSMHWSSFCKSGVKLH